MTTLEAIRAEIEQNAYPIVHGVNNHEKGMTLYGILQIIDKYAEQEPKTGHWLYSGENGVDRWTCDNCFDFVKKPTKVCPNCGAEMVE